MYWRVVGFRVEPSIISFFFFMCKEKNQLVGAGVGFTCALFKHFETKMNTKMYGLLAAIGHFKTIFFALPITYWYL